MKNTCKQCKQNNTSSDQSEYCDDCFWYIFQSDEGEEELMDTQCPVCGNEYDEVDYEYQICHICKFNNNIDAL